MLISLFGTVDASTLKVLSSRGHKFLVSDSPSDAKTLATLADLNATFALQKAAWRDVEHPLAKTAQRVGLDGEMEMYNTNGGFVRDAKMIERTDAVIVGEGVSPSRLALIDRKAAEFDRPVRNVELTHAVMSRQDAEAELDACLSTPAEEKPKRQRKAKPEVTTESIPF